MCLFMMWHSWENNPTAKSGYNNKKQQKKKKRFYDFMGEELGEVFFVAFVTIDTTHDHRTIATDKRKYAV